MEDNKVGVKENKRKLRNYLINFGVQRRIIVINLIYMLLVLILTIAVIYTHIFEKEVGNTALWHFGMGDFSISLSAKFVILYAVLILTFILAVSTQLWMTHRVCGAIINIINTFKRFSQGNLDQKINIRKDDLLKKEAEQLNYVLEAIAGRITELERDNEQLRQELKEGT